MTTLEQQKKAFALAMLRSPEAFEAANAIFGNNVTLAVVAAREWPNDPEVLQYQANLIDEHGEDYFLPSKADVARLIWKKAQHTTLDPDAFTKMIRVYAEVRGFIEKPGTTINNNNQVNNVMVVKDHGSDDAWEKKLAENQKKLTTVTVQ